jgi:hypothetical protein
VKGFGETEQAQQLECMLPMEHCLLWQQEAEKQQAHTSPLGSKEWSGERQAKPKAISKSPD